MPEDRRDLLEDVMVASKSSEYAVALGLQSMLAITEVVRRAVPDARVPSEQKLKSAMEAARPRLVRETSSKLLQMSAQLYRKFSDADLKTYEEFLGSPAGRHMTETFSKAAVESMVAGTKHFWQDMLPAGKPAGSASEGGI